MRTRLINWGSGALACVVAAAAFSLWPGAATAQEGGGWELDKAHTSIYFKIEHAGVSHVFGRFNEYEGDVSLGQDPSFRFDVDASSIDTNNTKRDNHLKSSDFFNVRQYPRITFTGTEVEETEEGYAVTGELTLHGVTREITIDLTDNGETEMPPGTQRRGFDANFTINRSDYNMTDMLDAVGDEVTLWVSFECTRE